MAAPAQLYTQMNDLVATTLRDLGEPNYTELTTDTQRFTAMNQLMRKKRITISSGYGIQWNVAVQHAQSAAFVGAGADDNVTIDDTMVQATADWRNWVTSYAFELREMEMNQGRRQIVNLVKERRDMAAIGTVVLLENAFWGPPVALADTITMWGVNTWIVKNGTAGFNGTVPSGYTSIGLNPTTYPRWSNYTAPYSAISKDDFVAAIRLMAELTDFMPPIDGLPITNMARDWGYYTNLTVRQSLEQLLEGQNENLGTDIASMDGKVLFHRTPVEWVPKLNADTTNPFYSICWADAKFYVFKDWFNKPTDFPNYPGKHTVSAHFLDSTGQLIFKNRRRSGVVSNGTSYPA